MLLVAAALVPPVAAAERGKGVGMRAPARVPTGRPTSSRLMMALVSRAAAMAAVSSALQVVA